MALAAFNSFSTRNFHDVCVDFRQKEEKPLQHPLYICLHGFACSGKVLNKHFPKLYSSHLNFNKRNFQVTFNVKLLKWILLINGFYFVFLREKLLKWSLLLVLQRFFRKLKHKSRVDDPNDVEAWKVNWANWEALWTFNIECIKTFTRKRAQFPKRETNENEIAKWNTKRIIFNSLLSSEWKIPFRHFCFAIDRFNKPCSLSF